MAVTPISKLQGLLGSGLKPSRLEGDMMFYISDADRRRVLHATHVQGGRLVTFFVAEWAGVISEIRSTQQIAGGGGGGQNTVDVQVGALGALASVYAAAGDGNNLLDNDAAGTTALNFPTAAAGVGILVTCTDGQTRTKFNKGDIIEIISAAGAAALGTVDIEVTIEKELPARGA